jgi:hypothetical protein
MAHNTTMAIIGTPRPVSLAAMSICRPATKASRPMIEVRAT